MNIQGALRVAFWSKQMCEQGTEVALFDYADYAEKLLGWRAWILYEARSHNNYDGAIKRFQARFGTDRVIALPGKDDAEIIDTLEELLHREGLRHMCKLSNSRTLGTCI